MNFKMPVLPRILQSHGNDQWFVLDDKWKPCVYQKQTGEFVPVSSIKDASFNLKMSHEWAVFLSAKFGDLLEFQRYLERWEREVWLFHYEAVPLIGLHPDNSYTSRLKKLTELITRSEFEQIGDDTHVVKSGISAVELGLNEEDI